MIIGANPYTAARAAPERTTAAAGSSVATAQSGTATDDTAPDPLAMLDNFMESAALSRKAFAEDRLKHLKEQMNTLALFNLAPGFLSGHTARMARELESAATDFAGSLKSLASINQTTNGTQTGAQADTVADTQALTGPRALPPAYLDILGDEMPAGFRLGTDDLDTAASFMNVAHHLRGVVEMTADDRKDSSTMRWNADNARESTSRVVDIMVRLEAASTFGKISW